MNRILEHSLIPISWNGVWSNDSKAIAVLTMEGGVLIYSDDFSAVSILQGHIDGIHSVAWSPDSKILACSQVMRFEHLKYLEQGSVEVSVQLWNVENCQPTKILYKDDNAFISRLLWTNDGRQLVGAVSNSDIIIWDTISGEEIIKLTGHSHYARKLQWVSEKRLVSFSYDHSIKVWDIESGAIIFDTATFNSEHIANFGIARDSKLLFYTLYDGSVHIFDTTEYQRIPQTIFPKWKIHQLYFTGKGDYFVGVTTSKKLIAQNLYSDRILSLDNGISTCIAIAIQPESSTIAAAFDNGSVMLWDLSDASKHTLVEKQKHQIRYLNWSPDGSKLLCSLEGNGVWLWEFSEETRVLVEPDSNHVEIRALLSMDYHPSDNLLIQGFGQGQYRICSMAETKCQILSTVHKEPIFSIQWNHGGSQYLVAGYYGTIDIFESSSHQLMKSYKIDGDLTQVEWQSNNSGIMGFLFTSSEQSYTNVVSIDLKSDKIIKHSVEGLVTTWDTKGETYVSVSRFGQEYLHLGQEYLHIYKGSDLKSVQKLPFLTWEVSAIRLQPNGNQVAIGFDDGSLLIWDIIQAKLIMAINYHATTLDVMAWHPNKDIIACGGDDNQLSIWDTATSTKLHSCYHPNSITAIVWSPNGQVVYAASIYGLVTMWTME